MAILGSEDEAKYIKILRNACEEQTEDVIANRLQWQTRRAHDQLLWLAARGRLDIRILCGTGSTQFFDGNMARCLCMCASAGCEITIIIWNDNTDQIAPGLMEMAADGRVVLLLSGTRELGNKIHHFVLVGDRAYRVEAPHEYIPLDTEFTDTSPKLSAKICFNDPRSVKKHQRTMDLVRQICTRILAA